MLPARLRLKYFPWHLWTMQAHVDAEVVLKGSVWAPVIAKPEARAPASPTTGVDGNQAKLVEGRNRQSTWVRFGIVAARLDFVAPLAVYKVGTEFFVSSAWIVPCRLQARHRCSHSQRSRNQRLPKAWSTRRQGRCGNPILAASSVRGVAARQYRTWRPVRRPALRAGCSTTLLLRSGAPSSGGCTAPLAEGADR